MTAPTKEQAMEAVSFLMQAAGVDKSESADVLRSFIESTSDAELPVGEPVTWTPDDEARLDKALADHYGASSSGGVGGAG